MLASRVSRVSSSPTLAVLVEAERLRRQGVDVVDFGAGEPDFPTPSHVKGAAHEAIDGNFTRYTTNAGIDELKHAIVARYRTDYGVEYKTSEVIVSAGGKQALYNAALALFGPGDEVITHAPGWPTLVEQIKLADAIPVVVRTHADDGFRLHPGRVTDAITPRTRGIVLNSPGNPTGALIGEDDLAAIAETAVKHDLWIVLESLLRASHLRRRATQLAEGTGGPHARPYRALRIGIQGLRDDRLAVRVDHGTGAGRYGM